MTIRQTTLAAAFALAAIGAAQAEGLKPPGARSSTSATCPVSPRGCSNQEV